MATRHIRGRALRHHPHRPHKPDKPEIPGRAYMSQAPYLVGGYYSGQYGQNSVTTGQIPPVSGPAPGPMQENQCCGGGMTDHMSPDQFADVTTDIGNMAGVVEGNASPATGGASS